MTQDLLASEVKEKTRSKRKIAGKRVAFLQDNARPHTAKTTMDTVRNLKWNLLPHPPYSPDLWTTPPSSGLFGNGYAANQKPFLKRASFRTLEGSTLKTDMCKCFVIVVFLKKKSVPVIFEPPCILLRINYTQFIIFYYSYNT
jgi:hypothetical protein